MSDGYYNETVKLRLTVKCPTCCCEWGQDTELLLGRIVVYCKDQVCNVCGCIFDVRATMDIAVVKKKNRKRGVE